MDISFRVWVMPETGCSAPSKTSCVTISLVLFTRNWLKTPGNSMRSGLAALTLLVMSAGSSGIAQLIGGPAEVPPASYTAREYVDSKGCAFQRASVSGTLLWLPRVTSDNQPVCNKAPTLGGSVPATALGTKIETPTVPASAKPGRTAPERVATVTTSAHGGAYGEVKLIEQQEVQQSATLCLSARSDRYSVLDQRWSPRHLLR
jgi:hypothetical protein